MSTYSEKMGRYAERIIEEMERVSLLFGPEYPFTAVNFEDIVEDIYNDGYDVGYDEGHTDGFKDGYAECKELYEE